MNRGPPMLPGLISKSNGSYMILSLVAALLLAPQGGTLSQESSGLRVLFVGHDPENPQITFADPDDPKVRALVAERTASFRGLLERHFEAPRVIHASEYKPSMSEQVDVTIFDALPNALKEAKRDKDPRTGEHTYEPAEYLPATYDRPTLAVASTVADLGETLGWKLDWL